MVSRESVIADVDVDQRVSDAEDQSVLSPRLPENVTQLLKDAEFALRCGAGKIKVARVTRTIETKSTRTCIYERYAL